MTTIIIDKRQLLSECVARFDIAFSIGEDLHQLISIIAEVAAKDWLYNYYVERVLYSDELFNGHHEPLDTEERRELQDCCEFIHRYLIGFLESVIPKIQRNRLRYLTPSYRTHLKFVYDD